MVFRSLILERIIQFRLDLSMERLPFLMEVLHLSLLVLDHVPDISESGEKLVEVLGRVRNHFLVVNLIDHGHLRGD